MLKTVDRMPTSVWPGLFRNWFQKHTSLYSPYIRYEDEGPQPIPALKPFIKKPFFLKGDPESENPTRRQACRSTC